MTVERPVVAEDLDRAAREERRTSEEAGAPFLDVAEGARDAERNAAWELSSRGRIPSGR